MSSFLATEDYPNKSVMSLEGSNQHVNESRNPHLASIEKQIQELEASTLFIYNAVLYVTNGSTLPQYLDCNCETMVTDEIRPAVHIVHDEVGEDEAI